MSTNKREIAGHGTETITITLTDADKARVAEDFAATHADIEALKEERKAVNAKLSDKRGHVAELAEQLQTGSRPESFAVRYEWVNGATIAVIREEDDVELHQRAATDEERQGALQLVEGGRS